MGTTSQTPLRTAIFQSGQRQIVIAKKAGLHESRLSKIVHGHIEPREDEKASIARVLRMPVTVLFPEALSA